MAQRVPTEAANPESIAARYIARHGIARYRSEYEKGWRASMKGGSEAYATGNHSDAYEDGYLDAANRDDDKWHMLKCPNHDTCGRG